MAMLNRKIYLSAAVVWIVGLCLLIAVDFGLRQMLGTPYSLGMPEELWFLLQIGLGLASLGLIFYSVRNMPWTRAFFAAAAGLLIGGAFYVIALWLYVIGTGIDSV